MNDSERRYTWDVYAVRTAGVTQEYSLRESYAPINQGASDSDTLTFSVDTGSVVSPVTPAPAWSIASGIPSFSRRCPNDTLSTLTVVHGYSTWTFGLDSGLAHYQYYYQSGWYVYNFEARLTQFTPPR